MCPSREPHVDAHIYRARAQPAMFGARSKRDTRSCCQCQCQSLRASEPIRCGPRSIIGTANASAVNFWANPTCLPPLPFISLLALPPCRPALLLLLLQLLHTTASLLSSSPSGSSLLAGTRASRRQSGLFHSSSKCKLSPCPCPPPSIARHTPYTSLVELPVLIQPVQRQQGVICPFPAESRRIPFVQLLIRASTLGCGTYRPL